MYDETFAAKHLLKYPVSTCITFVKSKDAKE
jgi:hypothetical protein